MPPQFIGPKLLTALHNVAQLPVMESAGMLSPLVIKDMVMGGGKAFQRFIEHSPCPVTGVNLCTSSRKNQDITCDEMENVIGILIESRLII